MAGLEGKQALVIQALRHLGEDNVGKREIETLRSVLSPQERLHFLKNTRFTLDWVHDVAKRIAEVRG
jgi:hypothetical protein